MLKLLFPGYFASGPPFRNCGSHFLTCHPWDVFLSRLPRVSVRGLQVVDFWSYMCTCTFADTQQMPPNMPSKPHSTAKPWSLTRACNMAELFFTAPWRVRSHLGRLKPPKPPVPNRPWERRGACGSGKMPRGTGSTARTPRSWRPPTFRTPEAQKKRAKPFKS